MRAPLLLRPGLVLAALTLALQGCATAPAPSALPADLANRLPAVAADFQRGAVLPVPGEGREAAYSTRGRYAAAATVSLLPAGTGERLPDGIASPKVLEALDQALDEAMRAGPNRMVAEVGRMTLPAGAATPGLLCASTAGRYGRERVRGLACAGVVEGAMLRLRVAMPARNPPPADAEAFATAILGAVQAPPPRS